MAKPTSVEEQIADIILEAVTSRLAPLVKRIEVLEAKPDVKYAGSFTLGKDYSAGDLVTRGGGLWLCLESGTTTQPGTDAKWKLIVKSAGGER